MKTKRLSCFAVIAVFGFAPSLLAGGVRYHVTINSEMVAGADAPKRMKSEGDVSIDGDVIRVENYRFNTARPEQPVTFVSRDGGKTFEVTDAKGTVRPLPSEFSLDPMVAIMRANAARSGPEPAATIELDPVRAETIGGRKARHHRVVARFAAAADERNSPDPTKAKVEMEVWVVDEVPTRVPVGLQAWASGFVKLDQALRQKVGDVKGFPIKSVVRLVTERGAEKRSIISTLEVSDIQY